jgi:23S rRNA (adenine2503-C2)-methyltransferase
VNTNFYQYDYPALRTWLNQHQLPISGVDQLYNWHYRHKKVTQCQRDLALKTQAHLANEMSFALPVIARVQASNDGTVKFLLKLHDGEHIETVLIPFQAKYSVCLSSQVGCAMKCSFCFTGTQGLTRHLAIEEIIGQFIVAWNWLKENRPAAPPILSVVFMGQGEPLHNFDAVKGACGIFLEKKGISLAKLRITISTAGYLPGLLRWKNQMPGVNLALSLHAAIEEKRQQLIPLNQRYPLADIMQVIDTIPMARKQYVTYEYLVVQDFNDSQEDAVALKQLLQNRPALINLIAFNPYPGSQWQRPSPERMLHFKTMLADNGLTSTIRSTKGDDILAACGQLNT